MFSQIIPKIAIVWQSFASPKICELSSDKLSQVSKVDPEICLDKKAPKHI